MDLKKIQKFQKRPAFSWHPFRTSYLWYFIHFTSSYSSIASVLGERNEVFTNLWSWIYFIFIWICTFHYITSLYLSTVSNFVFIEIIAAPAQVLAPYWIYNLKWRNWRKRFSPSLEQQRVEWECCLFLYWGNCKNLAEEFPCFYYSRVV